MHDAAMAYVRGVLQRTVIPPGPVLEIGGRNINGTVRPLFHEVGPYASIDLYDGPGVDLVGDVCELNPVRTVRQLFHRPNVSCVVCCEVLEHTSLGDIICHWAARALAPAGVFIVTAANPSRVPHSAIDGGPLHDGEYYQGVSPEDLRRWLQYFDHCDITTQGADIYATAWKRRLKSK